MLVIEKPTVENVLSSVMKSGVGLDISKNSTGITIFENGKIETYQSVIEFDSDSELRYYNMEKALEDDLLSLLEGKHFEIIGIEDAIDGENFNTVRVLILLNSVIDRLIGEGKVTCDYFKRIGNTVWKKWLRTLRPVKKYEKDKIEIENTMIYLDHELAVSCNHLKKSEKDKMGYQDQLDSTGVLLGVGLERKNLGATNTKSKKQTGFEVELFTGVEEIEKFYGKDKVTRISLSGNLDTSAKQFFKDLPKEEEHKVFYIVVDSLGTLGLHRGITDLEDQVNYVAMRKKVVS